MPQSFKDKYPKTRVIIDGTEIKCQTPSSLVSHSETYSTYKSHTTFKGLIGIAPSGHITFISQLHAGSISDRELTVRFGILKLPFSDGDIVMADKQFKISDLLEPIGVALNINYCAKGSASTRLRATSRQVCLSLIWAYQ